VRPRRCVREQLLTTSGCLSALPPRTPTAAELHKLFNGRCERPLDKLDVHEPDLPAALQYLRAALALSEHGGRERSLR
jgi:hypothetical protein